MRPREKTLRANDPAAQWWSPIWEFAVQAFVGTLLFALIALPAVGLNFLVKYIEREGAAEPLCYGLSLCEYTLFVVDGTVFLVFIVRHGFKSARKLW
jgi:hypothetical protein